MERNKHLLGKLIIGGNIELSSPLLIGCGEDYNTDIDVIKDKKGAPFIPATSFVGVLKQRFHEILNSGVEKFISDAQFSSIFGDYDDEKTTASILSCSDLTLAEDSYSIEVRDGVKISGKTGMAENNSKFDYEVVGAGAKFKLKIEIDLFSDLRDVSIKEIENVGGIILKILKGGINLGAKTNSGLGRAALKDGRIIFLGFNKKEDILLWLNDSFMDSSKDCKDNSDLINWYNNIDINGNDFVIKVSLAIKNSLIIRSYSDDPAAPDASHLKSAGKYVISGTSIKGALRARAERIIRAIADGRGESEKSQIFIDALFGNSNVREGVKVDIPSRVIVEEVEIKDVCGEVQSRIKIDRFTGGVINAALFDSMPVFPIGKESNIKNFVITVKKATDMDKGLMLLLLKDLWTGNLAIGGEKNIGRGVFIGKGAIIKNLSDRKIGDKPQNEEIRFFEIHKIPEDVKKEMQGFVDNLNEMPEAELKKYEAIINKHIADSKK
ncbi:MAG: hypothetical protein EVG15_01070 [Candidatus Acididesulfobacter diazotrophicus]|jgi:CRISPR/Cas system CSM-associated protein Csm3 (group 7 of RAMP superfamily)|uniref:CRISPR type III-associated protein domain-containing protein n=1 Tax=Candidatus Acididesulfobacter diazotrophicus TaxID=2597226 RepID=A0A519BQF9_9DELT|nr:MAG: hypothetical protein EVG15_01070 [Candidatus Acididesulfobacter diazotrophicus]